MPFLVFLLSATALVVAGVRLARDGDTIASGTGLGGLWVGAVLVAAATSLPEIATDVSAVRQGARGLAIGDLFGSNMANMLILALADLATRQTRILTRVAVNQLAVGALAIALATIATLGVLRPGPAMLTMGWAPLVVAVAYAAGMRYLHRNRPEPPFRDPAEIAAAPPRRGTLGAASARFAAAALLVLVAAPFLAAATAAIAAGLGLSHGFAGVVILAVVTSLPEAIVTFASLRTGSYDLAIGNLLGSNCFNMAAITILEVADGRGSVLADADPELPVAALTGVLLTTLAMLGVLDRAERSPRRIDLGPVVMVAVYVAGLVLVARSHG